MAEPAWQPARPRRLTPLLTTLLVVDILLLAGLAVLLALRFGDPGPDAAPGPGPTTSVEPETEPEPSAPAQPTEAVTVRDFQLPSGNIVCQMADTSATCTILEFGYEPPPAPEGCEGGVGAVLTVTAEEGPTMPCVAEPPGPPGEGVPVLEYGRASTIGEMTCQSSTNGATCRHNPTGRGFSVARAGYLFF
jgi:hypothetical protein